VNKADVIEEPPRGLERTHIKGKHGAGAFLLAASYVVLRMRSQSRVKDFLILGWGIKMARHGDAVGIVPATYEPPVF